MYPFPVQKRHMTLAQTAFSNAKLLHDELGYTERYRLVTASREVIEYRNYRGRRFQILNAYIFHTMH